MLTKSDCEFLRDKSTYTSKELCEMLAEIHNFNKAATAALCLAELKGTIDALLDIIERL